MIISSINQSIFLLICILKIKEVTICSLVNSLVLTRNSCLVGEKASKAAQKVETGRSKKVPSRPVSHSTISMSLLSPLIQ